MDRIAVASTALAMRALQRAVKRHSERSSPPNTVHHQMVGLSGVRRVRVRVRVRVRNRIRVSARLRVRFSFSCVNLN